MKGKIRKLKVTSPKILGQLTSAELAVLNAIQRIINTKVDELAILKKGQQYQYNIVAQNHKFPDSIRIDFQSGVVYDIPVDGTPEQKEELKSHG